METRKLGGLEVSVVGLGCNNLGRRIDEGQSASVVGAALEAGVTLFDTADVYGEGLSEEYLGKALGARRQQVHIATKFGGGMGGARTGAKPRWIEQAVDHSLSRLGTEWIDLYQLHTPDPDTPIEETLAALDRLVEAGKVRVIGCSNFDSGQIDQAQSVSDERGLARFASVQNQYSLLHREPEQGPDGGVIGACQRHGMSLLPYFPLASGLLTGKYRAGEAPPAGTRLGNMPAERASRFLNGRNLQVVERLQAFCQQRGRTLLELAISWLAARPVVASVIAGATRPEQVRANVAAAGWELDEEDLAEVDRITR
ncbi:MAG: aldo/keto reductase [Actinomycetota bacterium]|nr:aldo/keto reductase [Actinomycetota bacterium]